MDKYIFKFICSSVYLRVCLIARLVVFSISSTNRQVENVLLLCAVFMCKENKDFIPVFRLLYLFYAKYSYYLYVVLKILRSS